MSQKRCDDIQWLSAELTRVHSGILLILRIPEWLHLSECLTIVAGIYG